MTNESPLPLPRALLLDMDGTLTEPSLDFPAIKREMGIGEEPILEAMAKMDAARLKAAEAVLDRHEVAAAEGSVLSAGCRELLAFARRRGVATALITRNCRRSVETVVAKHGLGLDVLVSRDERPFKPHPAPLVLACKALGVPPSRAWMVGDGRHDIEAGSSAGIRTVWVSLGREREFPTTPWRVVRDLPELLVMLNASS